MRKKIKQASILPDEDTISQNETRARRSLEDIQIENFVGSKPKKPLSEIDRQSVLSIREQAKIDAKDQNDLIQVRKMKDRLKNGWKSSRGQKTS